MEEEIQDEGPLFCRLVKRRQVKCSNSRRFNKKLKWKFLTITFKLWKFRCILTSLILFQAAVLFAKLLLPVSDVNCCTFKTITKNVLTHYTAAQHQGISQRLHTCPSAGQVTLFRHTKYLTIQPFCTLSPSELCNRGALLM